MILKVTNSVKDVLQDRCDALISCSTALYAHKEYEGIWYYLWKHETLHQDTWLVSYGSQDSQNVFLVTQSRIAAELVYKHAIGCDIPSGTHGLMHVNGYLV